MTIELPEPEMSGLLTGDALGLIGPPYAKWGGSPAHYPRIDLFTAAQMLTFRDKVLDEAAKVAEWHNADGFKVANAIRALKGTT